MSPDEALTLQIAGGLAEQAAEMLFAVERDGLLICHANRAATAMLGFRREEIVGKPITEIDCGLAASLFWRDVAGGAAPSSERAESEIRRKDGSLLAVERSVHPFTAAERAFLAVAVRDISAQRAVERKLDDVTGQLNSILESTGDGVLAFDLAGQVLVMNRCFGEQWGLLQGDGEPARAVLLAHMVAAAKNGQDLRAFLEADPLAWDVPRSLVVELANGTVLRLCANPLKVSGAVAGSVLSCTDISERVRYEERLAQQNQALEETVMARTARLTLAEAETRLILQSTAEGLIGAGSDGRIIFANRAAADLLGRPAESLMAMSLHAALHGADVGDHVAASCPLMLAVQEGRTWHAEQASFRRGDGRLMPVDATVHPMDGTDGQRGAVLSFSDASVRRETEHARDVALAEAKRLAQIKSEFLANMSHEIRTPLNGVIGIAQIGYRRSMESTKSRDYFAKIIESGNLLLGIINDILDFSKIDAGKLRLEPRVTDPVACLERCLALVKPQVNAATVTLRFELGAGLPRACMLDSLRLEQVVINLLSNALKFTERGSVTLGMRLDCDQLVIGVVDTGIGMDSSQLARVFDPFEQADGSTTRRFGGTGLGLSITRHLVMLMNGRIVVDSKPGRGSRFEVRLPVILPASGEPVEVAPEPSGDGGRLAGLRILAAEDNEINQFVIREMLANEGAQASVAGDGAQALARVAEQPEDGFDLVLMDVQMPVLNGYEATIRIRELRPDLPVVALTAHALAEERELCYVSGMIDLISKPVDPEQLVEVILRHVRRRTGEPALYVPPKAAPQRAGAIDLPALRARWIGNPGTAERLLRAFVDSCDATEDQLDQAIGSGDLEHIGFVAHSLKAALSSIAATQAAALAAKVQAAANAGLGETVALADRLACELRELKSEAGELVAEGNAPPSDVVAAGIDG